MAELPPAPVRVAVAGLDVVRGPDGHFRVLEDNVRTPSGFAYALAARELLDRHLPPWLADGRVSFEPAVDLLARSLRAAAPEGVDDPSIALLTDGRRNSAWYEHARLARMLEIPLVQLDDLSVRGGRLMTRTGNTHIRGRRRLPAHRRGPPHECGRRAHRRRRRARRAAVQWHAHLRQRVRSGYRG